MKPTCSLSLSNPMTAQPMWDFNIMEGAEVYRIGLTRAVLIVPRENNFQGCLTKVIVGCHILPVMCWLRQMCGAVRIVAARWQRQAVHDATLASEGADPERRLGNTSMKLGAAKRP